MFRESTSTARLVLRPLTEADAEEMAGVLAAPELYAFIGGEPPTVDGLRSRYARLAVGRSADGSQVWVNWIARLAEDGAAVGTVQATVGDFGAGSESGSDSLSGHDGFAGRCASVAWVVGLPWQGRGYAVEAASALIAWLRERGVAEIRAHIHPDHAASARVAGRLGLVPTGELDDEGEQIWRAQGAPRQQDAERMENTR